jgi:hypothetical protein
MRRRLTLALLLSALLCSACGRGQRPLYQVRGKVLLDGKPTPHALVVFHPVGEAEPDAARPRANVAEDGTFTLTTFEAGDGAYAGDYAVTVEWWLSRGRDEAPVNRLSARYAKPATSGLRATVAEGHNDLQPFNLRQGAK